MRTNLNSNFETKMEEFSRTPLQYMIFHFDFGDIYVSDRPLTIDGNEALPIVESWGELKTVGGGGVTGNTRQQTISVWNGGDSPFSNQFYIDNPLNVFVDLYQTFDGLADSDSELIESFVVQDPIQYHEVSRLLSFDLVTTNMRYDSLVGDVIRSESYPNAEKEALGQGINLIAGEPGEVSTHYVKAPLSCTMKGSILKNPVTIQTYEDLDELGFPQSGIIEINQELMVFDSRGTNTIVVSARGHNSTQITEHRDSSSIDEYITDHTFLISQGPLDSCDKVLAGGQEIDPSEYTLDIASNPATITFPVIPKIPVLARGTTNFESTFDAETASNLAAFPQYAYDLNNRAFGATIDDSLTPLALIQNTQEEDIGDIVKLFLHIEHWASKFYFSDQCDVWVEGIGVIGQLSRPSSDDDFTYDAEVNIEHGHDHVSGGTHKHISDTPSINEIDPGHPHTPTATISEVTVYPGSWNYLQPGIYTEYASVAYRTDSLSFTTFNDPVAIYLKYSTNWFVSYPYDEPILECRYRRSDGVTRSFSVLGSSTRALSGSGRLEYLAFRFRVQSTGDTIRFKVDDFTLIFQLDNDILDNFTSLDATLANAPNIALTGLDTLNKGIKDIGDVQDIPQTWKAVQAISQANPTRTVTDKFELTQYLSSVDWSWLQGREIQVRYNGSSDGVKVVVTYAYFQVEYLARTLEKNTDITCFPVGSIESRPDGVIQYLLEQSGLSTAMMGSVEILPPGVWDDTETWDDTEVWLDEGQGNSGTPPAGAAFERAAIKYESLGYTIDGVIDATLSTRQAVSEVARQSRGRLTWESGLAKLSVMEPQNPSNYAMDIQPGDLQLRSISVDLGNVQDITNKITSNYDFDNAGNDGYQSNLTVTDEASITKHGTRENPDNWDFDLVRNSSMMEDVTDFYLWLYGLPVPQYKFNLYMPAFPLEKQDNISLTAANTWDKISGLPLIIQDVSRVFGSGKNKQINKFEISAIAPRVNKLFANASDNLLFVEDVSIDLSFNLSFAGTLILEENITFNETLEFSDTLALNETFTANTNYVLNISDDLNLTEAFGETITLNISENMTMNDGQIYSDLVLGFGTAPFGSSPFGSNAVNRLVLHDSMLIQEEIEIIIT